MKKLFFLILFFITTLPQIVLGQDEVEISKIDWLYTKRGTLGSHVDEDFSLFCKIFYNQQYQPIEYLFVFRAQNDEYSHIEDRFVIWYGDAQSMYDTLQSIWYFSKNNRENGLQFKIGDIALTNMKIFGWKTEIQIGRQYHFFAEKDFKKMLQKLEDFCKKNHIPLTKKTE